MLYVRADSILTLQVNTPSWVEDRSRLCASTMTYFSPRTGTLQFQTSSAGSRNAWNQTIYFKEWDTIVDAETMESGKSWNEIKNEFPDIMNAEVWVHCNCPAFLWYGSQYNLTTRDTALYPLNIAPDPTRNSPHVYQQKLSNVICKHLASVFNTFF